MLRVSTIGLMYVCVIITFLQGLSDSRLEKSQSLLHCFKGTKGKGFMPLALHCGAASDRKIQTSAFPVSSFIMKPLIKLTRKKKFIDMWHNNKNYTVWNKTNIDYFQAVLS